MITSRLEHYHEERAYQWPGNDRIERSDSRDMAEVQCNERFGGDPEALRAGGVTQIGSGGDITDSWRGTTAMPNRMGRPVEG